MSEETTETTMAVTTPITSPKSIEDLKPKMMVNGKVNRLELYGAFIDIGVGANALVHISQLGKERINRVADVLNVGDDVTVWVSKVDPARQQIMVTMIEPFAVDWSDLKKGAIYTGRVSRLENFGAFIDIGAEREGLVHISELSHDYVKHPKEVLNVGDEKEVQVLGFSKRKRRIDLSIKTLLEKPEQAGQFGGQSQSFRQEIVEDFEEEEDMPTAMEVALRKAMGDDMPVTRKKGKKRRRRPNRRAKMRAQQEDLLSRTMQAQSDN